MGKRFVPVMVLHHEDGRMEPKVLYWDGLQIVIDKVLDFRPDTSMKANAAGMRYTVLIKGQRRELYHTGKGWFVPIDSPDDPKETND